jgi:hypothetical protein
MGRTPELADPSHHKTNQEDQGAVFRCGALTNAGREVLSPMLGVLPHFFSNPQLRCLVRLAQR